MPTNAQRLAGALTSIGITVAGAWLASNIHSPLTSASAQTSFPRGLTVTIDGVRATGGKLVVMVFAGRDAYKAYDVTKAAGYKEAPSQEGSVVVGFPDLKAGPYAIAAFHDEDDNDDFNMSTHGPAEGYATSGAVDAYDTPTFRKASITSADTTIQMYYPD